MKIFKTYRFLFTIAVVVLMVSACKTVAVLPTKTPVKNVNIAALTTKIKANYPRIGQLRSRIKATYFDGKREQQIIVLLRMKDNNVIWMSATMLIPIAKLMLTKKRFPSLKNFRKPILKGILIFLMRPIKPTLITPIFKTFYWEFRFPTPLRVAGNRSVILNIIFWNPKTEKGFNRPCSLIRYRFC